MFKYLLSGFLIFVAVFCGSVILWAVALRINVSDLQFETWFMIFVIASVFAIPVLAWRSRLFAALFEKIERRLLSPRKPAH